MTSSGLIRLFYIAILTGSVERVRTESATSSSANRKETDGGGELDSGNRIFVDEDETSALNSAADKRKWGENTMQAWGKRSSVPSNVGELSLPPKNPPCIDGRTSLSGMSSRDRRKWGEKSMSVWGKRHAATGCAEDNIDAQAATERTEKRKWGEKTMQVWGKRPSSVATANDDEVNEDGNEMIADSQKRKWGENSMSAWGKRQHETDEAAASDKRKWGSNSMMVWGKREHQQLNDEEPADDWSHTTVKRGTDLDAEINDLDDDVRKFQEQKMATIRLNEYGGNANVQAARPRGWHRRHGGAFWGPKRKWETNTMKVWGKRTSGGSDWRGVRTVDAA